MTTGKRLLYAVLGTASLTLCTTNPSTPEPPKQQVTVNYVSFYEMTPQQKRRWINYYLNKGTALK